MCTIFSNHVIGGDQAVSNVTAKYFLSFDINLFLKTILLLSQEVYKDMELLVQQKLKTDKE